MKVLLFPNYKKNGCGEIVSHVLDLLCPNNVEIYSEIMYTEKIGDKRVKFISSDIIDSSFDAAIVIGGDGSIIKAAHKTVRYGIPLVGINLGTLGFLTCVERDELNLLSLLASGNYSIEEHLSLCASVIHGGEKKKFLSVNDIVICKNAFSRIIDIDVMCGGVNTIHYKGDGIIISTPSGSTAYAMSAGGPIIHPSVKAISITPICVHSLFARTLILPENEAINVCTNAGTEKRQAYLTSDGFESTEIFADDTIEISRNNENIKFISFKGKSYYSAINQKLMNGR